LWESFCIDGSRDGVIHALLVLDARGKFWEFLLLLFHLERDQRLIEIEARLLLFPPLVDIPHHHGRFCLKKF